jgi:UDP-glucose 4-epimerase
MSHPRILVTGGNGYVGCWLTRLLLEGNHDVCVMDTLRYGKIRFTASECEKLKLTTTDIRDADGVRRIMEEFAPTVIVHLAAIHYIPECEQNPALASSVNVVGTLNLLQHCPAGCRFVFASSGAVYKPEEKPHEEDASEVGPNDIYGLSKLHAEHYVRIMAAKRGLQGAIVRLFNVIGPGETNPHLLPELVAQLKAGRTTVDLGNLSPRRDYISVRDAAQGFAAAALGPEIAAGDAFVVNLGTSRTYSVAEIIDKLRMISATGFEVRCDQSRLRAVDRPFLAANIDRIDRLLGWRPLYTADDAITELWEEPDLAERLAAQYL